MVCALVVHNLKLSHFIHIYIKSYGLFVVGWNYKGVAVLSSISMNYSQQKDCQNTHTQSDLI